MSELPRLLVESEPTPRPTALPVEPGELSGRREVELALPDSVERIDWMGRGAWVVSGALAAAVVVALVVWKPDPPSAGRAARGGPALGRVQTPSGGVTPTIVRLAEARLFAYGGPVLREGMQLPLGAPLREGDELTFGGAACLHLEPGAVLCAEADSRVSLNSLALAQRVVEVHAGGVAAELVNLPMGASFVMRTGELRLRAHMAELALRRSGDASMAYVTQGGAEVRRGTEVLDLGQDQGAAWSRAEGLVRTDVEAEAHHWVAQVLDAAEVSAAAPASAAASAAAPVAAPAPAESQDRHPGIAPEDGPVPSVAAPTPALGGKAVPEAGRAAHVGVRPTQTTAARPKASRRASSTGGAPLIAEAVANADETPSDAVPAAAAGGAEVPAASDPAGELVRRAQEATDRGAYSEAEEAYDALRAEFPKDTRALSAMVRLGDLRLRKMNDPLGSLGFYRGYLDAGSGSLDAQARLGVIAALERLKRYPHERKAIQDYLTHYPDSRRAPSLRERLELLGGG